ncbi:MAG TPA: metallophosphoesterase [Vicinamibacterales bacterium]|nr:metallophosphoesterase [Vicinamibacterales bacterium]
MRYLVLSDIHANLEALEAALAAGPTADAVLILGDLVGYGADPNAVIERVRSLPRTTMIRGNHDKVGAGIDSVRSFNHLARQAIEWTAAALTAEHRQWLAELARGPQVVDDLIEICHGAPFDEDFYIFDELDARRALSEQTRPLCLFGHTHVPAAFRFDGDFESFGPPKGAKFDIALNDAVRYLVNCGAVGQPRDGDARAAFGVLDTARKRLTVRRVEYDVGSAQAKIIAAGLPDVLAQRLGVGR